ncbi:MAG TPA: AAA family ATPase [Gaiellales bacterium]|nr:AAA family ATPase [Gaiellales bacterium]
MTTDPFELRRELPDEDLQAQGKRLVGFAPRFARLERQMRLLVEVDTVRTWAERHHQGGEGLVAALGDRYPLVLFHGDVGTGKTASAEAAADALARLLDVEGYLLKLSTRVRGIGHVGEMGTLISEAFDEALRIAGKSRFVTLLVDEGDALAFNRGAERAHHEDRVGVNTIIQKIDDARALNGRLLIILSTNRFTALDPAVVRRASLVESFGRPTAEERRELFEMTLSGVTVSPDELEALVAATGELGGQLPFTFSDIQTRLIPAAVARAYPERALTAEDLSAAAADLEPSPSMEEEA